MSALAGRWREEQNTPGKRQSLEEVLLQELQKELAHEEPVN